MSETKVGGPARRLGHRLVAGDAVPDWLATIVERIDGARLDELIPKFRQPIQPVRRRSAVLMLMSDGPSGPDLLLTARAVTLRSHAGQPAFPGGSADPGEDAVATALREGQEETGLDPASVLPVALLPEIFLEPSEFLVAPVLAFWQTPGPVSAVDPAETAAVARVPVTDLVDAANRGRVWHPSGYVGPAFRVADMLVWGFTAGLVDALIRMGGWERPWDAERYFRLPEPGRPVHDPEEDHLAKEHPPAAARPSTGSSSGPDGQPSGRPAGGGTATP